MLQRQKIWKTFFREERKARYNDRISSRSKEKQQKLHWPLFYVSGNWCIPMYCQLQFCSTITLAFHVSLRCESAGVNFYSILRSGNCGFSNTCFHAFLYSPIMAIYGGEKRVSQCEEPRLGLNQLNSVIDRWRVQIQDEDHTGYDLHLVPGFPRVCSWTFLERVHSVSVPVGSKQLI